MERREGDWDCPTCGMVVFASKASCPKCDGGSAGGKSGGARKSGDWDCPDCGTMNFASREECFKCNPSAGKSAGKKSRQPRDGDWHCEICGFMNFASRESCKKCDNSGAAQPAPAAPAAPAVAAAAASTPAGAIKLMAKMSASFKKAWILYCRHHERSSSDPVKQEEEFIAKFVDYSARLINEDMEYGGAAENGSSKPAAVAAAPAAAAGKRPAASAAGAAADGPAEKKKLVIKKAVANEIRALNAAGGLAMPIRPAAVAASLGQLDEGGALTLLADLRDQQDQVADPNDFINEQVSSLLSLGE